MTAKQSTKMPEAPSGPPMREYAGMGLVRVNEYKTVDWYTNNGDLYPLDQLITKLPKTWLGRLFMSLDQLKLEQSIRINREICRKWPRV